MSEPAHDGPSETNFDNLGFPDGTIATNDGSEAIASIHRRLRELDEGHPNPETEWPKMLGRFVIREVLGKGGFGVVFRASDPVTERDVALKVPRAGRGTDDLLLAEARSAARMPVHRNLTPIFDVVQDGASCYLVLEYCGGGPLSNWLKGYPEGVPPRLAATIVAALADGIHHAHHHGVLHRDLKPGNILLQEQAAPDESGLDFVPKVTDFGLARRDAYGDEVVGDEPHGTMGYIAPEQTGGRAAEIGRATDIYGLGAVLYRMLVGHVPFSGGNHKSMLAKVRDELPEPPRVARPEIPVDLEAIVLRCLEKEPGERYKTAQDLAKDLRLFLAGEPVGAPRWPLLRHVRTWVRRHPLATAGLIAAVLMLPVSYMFADWYTSEVALSRLETCQPESLPDLLPSIKVGSPWIAQRLRELHERPDERLKMATAIALAEIDPAMRDEAYTRWIDGPTGTIKSLAPFLRDRLPDLFDRLGADIRPGGDPAADIQAALAGVADMRRANAAIALIALGRDASGWGLLKHTPDPQARSLLIHRLDPAGIGPTALFERLRNEPDVSARRALVLALGETRDLTRSQERSPRPPITTWLLDRYENDPDPGLHGAVKWTLRRWAEQEEGDQIATALGEIDRRLAGADREGFGWRISKSGLTFVRFEGPDGLLVELADSEITVGRFLEFDPNHRYSSTMSPGPDHPMNMMTYRKSLAFFNSLSETEGLGPDDGYRLPTIEEFLQASRAGATTQRYYGTTTELLTRYACVSTTDTVCTMPVGSLKPNDLGLFDTLGNLYDFCSDPNPKPGLHAMGLGGWVGGATYHVDFKDMFADQPNGIPHVAHGFRPARTVRPAGRESSSSASLR